MRHLRRGESNRKKPWKIKQANTAFFKNPFNAGKNVFYPKGFTPLKCDIVCLVNYKKSALFDKHHQIQVPPLEGLPPPPVLSSVFQKLTLKNENLLYVLHSRRNSSSPGINMIPYKVHKKCPRIMSFLFKIFQSCLKLDSVPLQWCAASEVYIPKTKPPNSLDVKDFQLVALLNVEGKIFFNLVSREIEDHIIIKNKTINSSIQKGFTAKVPGCWVNMSVVWHK